MSELEDPALLVDELGRQFEVARTALQAVGRIAKQLQRRAQDAALMAGGPRVVRVKAVTPIDPATGKRVRRGVGRPPGQRNHLCILATPRQIEALRRQLAATSSSINVTG